MPTFAIYTLGCKVNTYESDMISQRMKENDFLEVPFSEAADIYIINTCTVTNIADRKSRQILHRARKLKPDALIVATGCYVDSVEQGKGLPETEVDLWVPNREKTGLANLCLRYLEGRKENAASKEITESDRYGNHIGIRIDQVQKQKTESYNETKAGERGIYPEGCFLTQLDGHTRAFVKIEDGCNMFCTYCIIPYVRGRVAARPVADTVREVELLAKKGVREIVLTGIHLSSMGKQLIETVEAIDRIEGIRRIRLGSMEPRFITAEVMARLSECGKLCPHFHLSLQSGSDEILKAMKRRYTTEEFLKSCREIRKIWPDAAITTDIIVGFPGETEENFEESCEFLKKAAFYEAHVFKYSRRKGTVADLMKNQLTEAVKSERSSRLICLADEQSHAFRTRFLKKENEFLAEETMEYKGRRFVTGYTREYVRCILPDEGLEWKQGDLLKGIAGETAETANLGEFLVLSAEETCLQKNR